MENIPEARLAFLSNLIRCSLREEIGTTLVLRDRQQAAEIRDAISSRLNLFDKPKVLVLDLAGAVLTPSAIQELVLPLAQRIQGGEYGTVRLVVSTTDVGVKDFIEYMAHVHQLPVYVCRSPLDFRQGVPAGILTQTESGTLDGIFELGGRVTASQLAEAESIKPNAAKNRLVNLERAGYLIRQQRSRREGDVYFEPRSATAWCALYEPQLTGVSNTDF